MFALGAKIKGAKVAKEKEFASEKTHYLLTISARLNIVNY